MTEEWRTVVGWDAYEVSNRGRVRRVRIGRGVRASKYVLRPTMANNGYLAVSLSQDGRVRRLLVHWLVAEAFIGSRLQHIDHIDGNRSNNVPSNLRYVTIAENNAAAGERHGYESQRRAAAKITPSDVIAIRAAVARGERQCDLAEEYGVGAAEVSRIVNRKRWASL